MLDTLLRSKHTGLFMFALVFMVFKSLMLSLMKYALLRYICNSRKLDVKSTKPTNQITLHLTFRFLHMLPDLFKTDIKDAAFSPKMACIVLLHISGFKECNKVAKLNSGSWLHL